MTVVEQDVEQAEKPRVSMAAIWFSLPLLIVAVMLVLFNSNRSTSPTESAPEVGFARDMIVHHAQAVELSLLEYDRTENETLRIIALDIMLTQQAQIGQMQGWLRVWGMPIASVAQPMAWMDMGVDGLMPGMATEEQIAALRNSSGVDADRLFINLMIPHHAAGIHMAEAIVERSTIPAVLELSRAVVSAQQREIDELNALLTTLSEG